MNEKLVDLHLHLDGSLSLENISQLLNYQPNKKPNGWDDMADKEKEALLSVSQDCLSLVEYLKYFDLPCSLLQTPDMVRKAMSTLVQELNRQGLVYADIRFAPQLFSSELREKFGAELSYEENTQLLEHETNIVKAALDGIEDAKKGKNIEVNIILCCMRNKDWSKEGLSSRIAANERTILLANTFSKMDKKEVTSHVVGIDLAGGEADNRNTSYPALKSVYDDNLDIIIHSGEAGTLEEKLDNIETAISLGAKRIGHGIALGCVYEDDTSQELKEKAKSLIEQIKEKGIALECCPTSNFQTKAVEGKHPMLKLLQDGVKVTINTDNMTVSRTTLQKEYDIFKELCIKSSLSNEETEKLVIQIQKNAIEASYMSDLKKQQYISQIVNTSIGDDILGN